MRSLAKLESEEPVPAPTPEAPAPVPAQQRRYRSSEKRLDGVAGQRWNTHTTQEFATEIHGGESIVNSFNMPRISIQPDCADGGLVELNEQAKATRMRDELRVINKRVNATMADSNGPQIRKSEEPDARIGRG